MIRVYTTLAVKGQIRIKKLFSYCINPLSVIVLYTEILTFYSPGPQGEYLGASIFFLLIGYKNINFYRHIRYVWKISMFTFLIMLKVWRGVKAFRQNPFQKKHNLKL